MALDSLLNDLFQWRPPHGFQGEVVVRSTVVEDYKTFWTNIFSTSITVFNTTLGGEAVEEERTLASVQAEEVANALSELSVPTIDANLTEWIPRERRPQKSQPENLYEKLRSEQGAWEDSGGAAGRGGWCEVIQILVLTRIPL